MEQTTQLPVIVFPESGGRVGSIVRVTSLESGESWIQVQAGAPSDPGVAAARAIADGDAARRRPKGK